MSEFGDKFRKEREKRGFSLDDVSNVTKISSRMLQAIEEEHFDQLPGGVFNKGFIRAYAKHLGLNGEEAVTDYLACLRQAQIDAHEVWEPQHPVPPPRPAPAQPRPLPAYAKPRLTRQPEAPTPRRQVEELPDLQLPRAEDFRPPRRNYGQARAEVPWRIVAVAALAFVLLIIFWIRHSRSEAASASQPAPVAASPVKTVQPPQPASTTLAGSAAAPAAGNQPSAHPVVNGAALAAAKSQPTQPIDAAASAAPPVPPAPASDAEGSDVTIRNLSPQKSSSPVQAALGTTSMKTKSAKVATRLTLVIRASETSWISVTADGQTASVETLIAPASTSIHAEREIVAKVGNAAGVTFLWNGREIPAQGAESEIKTFVFDANGMRIVP